MNSFLKIKKSRKSGFIPNVNHFPDTDTAIWNQADGKLWGLKIDAQGTRSVVLIGGGFNELFLEGDKHFQFNVNYKLEEVIMHNLNKQPSVHISDLEGSVCLADIIHLDSNTTRLIFTDYFTGKVVFN